MANPRRTHTGQPIGNNSLQADAPQEQYLDQFERVVERIKKHPLLDIDDRNAAFFTMIEHGAAGIASNESNTDVGHISYNARKQSEPSLTVSRALESIDKLLSAAQEIMKREPSLDHEAIEYMRRLRVKVRYAVSEIVADEHDTVPPHAPELFKEREKKQENPVDFIKRVYEPYLYKGIVRSDLSRLDPNLYVSLNRWISQNNGQMPDIGLPKRSEVIEEKLKQSAGQALKAPHLYIKSEELPLPDQERLRLYHAAQRRKRKTPNP